MGVAGLRVSGVGTTVAVGEERQPDEGEDGQRDREPDKDALHMGMMSPTLTPVNSHVKEVRCPSCKRYVGAFVGKAQCKSCSRWIMVDMGKVAD